VVVVVVCAGPEGQEESPAGALQPAGGAEKGGGPRQLQGGGVHPAGLRLQPGAPEPGAQWVHTPHAPSDHASPPLSHTAHLMWGGPVVIVEAQSQ